MFFRAAIRIFARLNKHTSLNLRAAAFCGLGHPHWIPCSLSRSLCVWRAWIGCSVWGAASAEGSRHIKEPSLGFVLFLLRGTGSSCQSCLTPNHSQWGWLSLGQQVPDLYLYKTQCFIFFILIRFMSARFWNFSDPSALMQRHFVMSHSYKVPSAIWPSVYFPISSRWLTRTFDISRTF